MAAKFLEKAGDLILVMLAGVTRAQPQSGAPVMTSATAVDYGWVSNSTYVDPLYHYQITATNAPTSFSASGLPADTRFDSVQGFVSGPAGKPGIYRITVSATNASGTGTAEVTLRIHPAAVGGSVSSGTYRVGDILFASVTLNTPVTVSGLLGLTGRVPFQYQSGSGTSQLTFIHRVTASDPAGKLPYDLAWDFSQGNATDANGLTITGNIPQPRVSLGEPIIDSATASPNPGRLCNLSVLARTGPGTQLLTVGFVTGGGRSGTSWPLLVRGIGPGLAPFGVAT